MDFGGPFQRAAFFLVRANSGGRLFALQVGNDRNRIRQDVMQDRPQVIHAEHGRHGMHGCERRLPALCFDVADVRLFQAASAPKFGDIQASVATHSANRMPVAGESSRSHKRSIADEVKQCNTKKNKIKRMKWSQSPLPNNYKAVVLREAQKYCNRVGGFMRSS